MSQFKVEFQTDNAAFDDIADGGNGLQSEIARVLRELADLVEGDLPKLMFRRYQNLKDINGNIIGTWRLK